MVFQALVHATERYLGYERRVSSMYNPQFVTLLNQVPLDFLLDVSHVKTVYDLPFSMPCRTPRPNISRGDRRGCCASQAGQTLRHTTCSFMGSLLLA